MDRDKTPSTTNDLIAALADGELDLREHPEALAKIGEDPQAAQRVAFQQQLKQACGKAMDTPDMKCPEALAARLLAMASGEAEGKPAAPATPAPSAQAEPYEGPAVIGRIGRWVPAAVAAVLLIAAGILFTQANPDGGVGIQSAAFFPVDQVDQFTGRHGDCAIDLTKLKDADRFGETSEFDQLPGKLADHFQTSTDGMRLSLDGIGYDYQLTGACALPGSGAVHIVYRNQSDPGKAISLWIKPIKPDQAELKEGQVYSIAGDEPMQPVIIWRQGELVYYLVGDSIEDCDKAVKQLRQAA